ncbi:MAG: hypothetical protein M0Q42_12785 [Xanthomonadales bacterium]|nr:hypothetical protein [Xanthomonadales bacterium]
MFDAIQRTAGDSHSYLAAGDNRRWPWVLAVLALLWLIKGMAWSAAALAGGLVVVLAGWLSGQVALAGGVQSSTAALSRLLAGMMLKWVVVIAGLVATAAAGLPLLPMLTGVIAALLTQMLAVIGRPQASKA